MPFYRYTAQDPTGKPISGAMEAATPDTAARRLTDLGLADVRVEGAVGTPPYGAANARPAPARPASARPASAPAASTPAASTPAAPRPTAPRPVSAGGTQGVPVVPRAAPSPEGFPRPAFPQPAFPQGVTRAPVAETPAAAVAPEVETYRVGIAPAKERSFFFDQFGRFIEAGISASEALERLGAQRGGKAGEFLRNAGRGAAAGIGIGEALRGGYVTEAECASLTAGERGGYVPQASARLADLAMDAHRLTRGFLYPLLMASLALFAGPCTRGVQDAAVNSIVRQDQAGGALPAGGTFLQEWAKTAPSTIPLGILFIALFFGAIRLWNAPFARPFRHTLSLRVWPLAPRARSEATGQLASHLAALAGAGIPPAESARLAAATIPNLGLRAETMRALGNVPDGTPLSQAISRTSLVSQQYRDIVSNGELTGDVPGALGRVARVEEGEYVNRSSFAGKGLFIIVMIAVSVLVAVYLGYAAKYWYSTIIRVLTSGD